MKAKLKDIIIAVLSGVFIFGFFLGSFLLPDTDFLMAERRDAQTFPELSVGTIMSGEFRENFEKYTQDQFPLRDSFRGLKAISAFYVFQNLENNDYILCSGSVSKLDTALRQDNLDYAASTFRWIYNNTLKDKNAKIYLSIIPDKNYFMAEKNGYLALDYDALINSLKGSMSYAEYIDITDTLELSDYYRTDTHWMQQCITETAQKLANSMGTSLPTEYEEVFVYDKFEGVYYKQAALPVKRDEIRYLTNETLESLELYDYETGSPVSVPLYDEEKAKGRDGYEFFLHGRKGLLVLENPKATTDRELIIFRDSFGSSMAPLLAQGYKKVTLVDLRAIGRMTFGGLVNSGVINAQNQDVLFLMSTTILNQSKAEGFK